MPYRQHPLLRFYARASELIGIAPLARSSDFPSKTDIKEYFARALEELPPFPPGEDGRHDEIRMRMESVAGGGHPDFGPFRAQVRFAAGRLADYTVKLATMGIWVPGLVVPGAVLHQWNDSLSDQETYGLGHRRVLEVTDYDIAFVVIDGEMAGKTGRYMGSADPEELAFYLQPNEACGPDCRVR